MCDFFSCVSDGQGKVYYFGAEMRKRIVKGELDYDADSHTSIAYYYRLDEDLCNKYEYNPLTRRFTTDQINGVNDSGIVKAFCKNMDFTQVVPELIIKQIVHPFRIERIRNISEAEISNLKQWASVGASVGASVWAYISSFFSIEKWLYIKHEPSVNPFQCCIDLWGAGLVPSFDGKTWRLHFGPKAEIVYEWKPE